MVKKAIVASIPVQWSSHKVAKALLDELKNGKRANLAFIAYLTTNMNGNPGSLDGYPELFEWQKKDSSAFASIGNTLETLINVGKGFLPGGNFVLGMHNLTTGNVGAAFFDFLMIGPVIKLASNYAATTIAVTVVAAASNSKVVKFAIEEISHVNGIGSKLWGVAGEAGSIVRTYLEKATKSQLAKITDKLAKVTDPKQLETILEEIKVAKNADDIEAAIARAADDAVLPKITTPNTKLQQWAQQGGYVDPRTNKWVRFEGTLAADHVYPKNLIKKLPGFDKLTQPEKDFLLNYPGNFEPLPKTWNSSKLDRLADDWAKTPMGRQATKEYIDALRERQQAFEAFANNLIALWSR